MTDPSDPRLERHTYSGPTVGEVRAAPDSSASHAVDRILDAREGLVLPTERAFLYSVLCAMPHSWIRAVEIGTWTGTTMQVLRRACDELSCIDPQPQWVQDESLRTRADEPVRLVRGYSPADLEASIPGPYTFVFVDGDHSAEGVYRDARALEALMEPGGVICFHDANHPPVQEGIARALREWKRPHQFHPHACDTIARTPEGLFGGIAVLTLQDGADPRAEPFLAHRAAEAPGQSTASQAGGPAEARGVAPLGPEERAALRPLIVTGMHRSGTSLTAGLLHRAGIFMGKSLLEGDTGNPRGHFEDKGILAFHTRFLADRAEPGALRMDEGVLREHPLRFTATEAEKDEADRLLAERARTGPWGWKDPRTCLLVDFWRERAPAAHFLVVFRHPLEVYESHLRRAGNLDLAARPELILSSYVHYQRPLLAAAAQAPEAFTFVHAHSVVAGPAKLLERVVAATGTTTDPLDLRAAVAFVQPGELAREPIAPERESTFRALFPEADAVYRELLDRAADTPPGTSTPHPLPEPPAAVQTFLEGPMGADPSARIHFLEAIGLSQPLPFWQECRERVRARLQAELTEPRRILREQEQHIAELRDWVARTEGRSEAINRQREAAEYQLTHLQAEIAEKDRVLRETREWAEELKGWLETTQQERDGARAEIAEKDRVLRETREWAEETAEWAAELKEWLETTQRERDQICQDLDRCKEEHDMLIAEKQRIGRELDTVYRQPLYAFLRKLRLLRRRGPAEENAD